VFCGQPAQALGQPVPVVPGGEEGQDLVGLEAAQGESERLERRAIGPLSVDDDDDDG